ncbi:DEAD/DEAH box helicase [Edwardsiella piscicida]|uniref:DEAD/DEAH box helicase n=2 Tax=Edwardsiella piscicida TaxID=1263550 RepID=UPI000D50BB9C|nr:ATP-binding domain-containing protein [Edwardsiella piscicida]EKS7812716.1 DEAD/DEAH box helicase [Edwardsiella piscicida]UCQ20448.1 ATP-binding domain-containing protein [Edwardsiella piscicida]
MSSFFFLQAQKNDKNAQFLNLLEAHATENKIQTYVIDRPLGDNKYSYSYKDAVVLLCPKHKIIFINFSKETDEFKNYVEDFLEDLGSLSDKFKYKNTIGRPRQWREELISPICNYTTDINIGILLKENKIHDAALQKKCELIISLLTGSINDIDRVKGDVPETLLDKVKQKILLFDGDQTRFIYKSNQNKKITIQGLSGTGKTELLLHKLKELYIGNDDEPENRIMFTCHNKILSASLKTRIPEFFNFMKVEEQIKWNERLWCEHAWGSQSDKNSGAYRYICYYYGIPFNRFDRFSMDFNKACSIAIENIKSLDIKNKFAFDYILLDESQDFPDSFFELCALVTKKTVFIAGDIFQSIFSSDIINEIDPDYLLSKCYRTDPRTLMFAHALGMGLFETPKLRWLEDNEWKACGYIFKKNKKGKIEEYNLTREPLRRFEDIDPKKTPSMQLVKTDSEIAHSEQQILSIIEDIKKKNPTVQPQDIGIIFFNSDRNSYNLADRLEVKIPKKFGWSVNKAYESKEKVEGSLFISNQNNVKGLEFPFVICITRKISNGYHFRNSLYMMLTRSFLQTYLVISEKDNIDIIPSIENGLSIINNSGSMIVVAPSDGEKERIRTTINIGQESTNFYDFVYDIFEDLGVAGPFRKPLFDVVRNLADENFDGEVIKQIISANYSFVKKGNKK